jgi:hypothetical protein
LPRLQPRGHAVVLIWQKRRLRWFALVLEFVQSTGQRDDVMMHLSVYRLMDPNMQGTLFD